MKSIAMPEYGDDAIAKTKSLAVVIAARHELAMLWNEDDLLRRPRRKFAPSFLETVYDRAEDVVRDRRAVRAAQIDTGGDVVGDIAALRDKVLADQQGVACFGDSAFLHRCGDEVHKSCPQRSAAWCPRVRTHLDETLDMAKTEGKKPPPPAPPPTPPTPEERLVLDGVHPDDAAFVVGRVANRHGAHFSVDGSPAAQRVRDWLYDERGSPVLYLPGTKGVGKTCAAAWAMLQVVGTSRMVDAYQLSARAREREWVDGWLEVDLLVVDEIGGEDLTEACRALVNRIAYVRGARGQVGGALRTIWTGNASGEDLIARYSERWYDRVVGSVVNGKPVKEQGRWLKGESRR